MERPILLQLDLNELLDDRDVDPRVLDHPPRDADPKNEFDRRIVPSAIKR